MNTILTLIIILVLLGILDFLWLTIIAKKFYAKELGNSLRKNFNFYSAIIVYIFLALGIFIFVLNNVFVENPLSALLIGIIFGIIVYGVYDLTNYAILKNYSLKLTVIDIAWGGFILGITSFLTKYISGLF